MKKVIAFALALVLTVAALSTVCFAQTEYPKACFVQICGLEGQCEVPSYCKWIEALDYTLNYETDEDGNRTLRSVTFTHRVEPVSVKIQHEIETGHWIREAKLEACYSRAGRWNVYQKVFLEELRITEARLVLLADGTVGETVTMIVKQATVTDEPIPEIP